MFTYMYMYIYTIYIYVAGTRSVLGSAVIGKGLGRGTGLSKEYQWTRSPKLLYIYI